MDEIAINGKKKLKLMQKNSDELSMRTLGQKEYTRGSKSQNISMGI